MHDGDLALASEKTRDLLDRAHRRRQPDPLCGLVQQGIQPFEAEGEVGPALGAGDGVHLVDDDRVDAEQ